jgi:hypothetical protein
MARRERQLGLSKAAEACWHLFDSRLPGLWSSARRRHRAPLVPSRADGQRPARSKTRRGGWVKPKMSPQMF